VSTIFPRIYYFFTCSLHVQALKIVTMGQVRRQPGSALRVDLVLALWVGECVVDHEVAIARVDFLKASTTFLTLPMTRINTSEESAMRRSGNALGALCVLLFCTQFASANVIYEDTFYWVPNGAGPLSVDVVVNPVNPPENAWVKIQETVYDDTQARQILQGDLGIVVHGSPIPVDPMDLYVYSITNLNYGNGPDLGGGNGVSGYNIVNSFNVPTLGIWGPDAAANWWDTPALNLPYPANWEWDIDANMSGDDGDGVGITLGNTFDGFRYAVPAGTPHGFVPAWVHSWSGGGAQEQPASSQIDVVNGFVSGPMPEPGTFLLLSISSFLLVLRRHRRTNC